MFILLFLYFYWVVARATCTRSTFHQPLEQVYFEVMKPPKCHLLRASTATCERCNCGALPPPRLSASLPASIPASLSPSLSVSLPACLSASLPPSLPAYLPACQLPPTV
eukprot:GHVU01155087.1.p2 GENE.GHVU01155087.1~~GHVU01155087.1.p2  ORF type:complete len:109 (+),score=4.77 GHVU01155087.1:238-564(+)